MSAPPGSALLFGLVDLVVSEEHPHLQRDRVERLRPDVLAALRDEDLDISILPPAIDGQRLSLGIDDPVMGDSMPVVDALLRDQIVALVGREDLAEPVGRTMIGIPRGRSGT